MAIIIMCLFLVSLLGFVDTMHFLFVLRLVWFFLLPQFVGHFYTRLPALFSIDFFISLKYIVCYHALKMQQVVFSPCNATQAHIENVGMYCMEVCDAL